MNKIIKFTIFFYIILNTLSISLSNENFFQKGLKLFENEKYDDAKFMFERSIVFNPKDSNSYLYLAKIYNHQEDKIKEEKNLDATLLIEPGNEEAILMLMEISYQIQQTHLYMTLLSLNIYALIMI